MNESVVANSKVTAAWREVGLRAHQRRLLWAYVIFDLVLAAFIRLWRLGEIKIFIFDETYYVKDAYSTWLYGYEGKWAAKVDKEFLAGNFSGLSQEGAFVAHPPLGKWLIGAGIGAFGPDSRFGWRIVVAVFGILLVALTMWLAWRLFANVHLVGLAGLLIALEGLAVSLSRVALLDGILAVFILAAFATLLEDQLRSRRFLAQRLSQWRESGRTPVSGPRPWLIATGVLIGLGAGVKWSAFYVLAAAGLWVVWREATARYQAGMRGRELITGVVFTEGFPAFLFLVPAAILSYLATWTAWFFNPRAWGHGRWAAAGGEVSILTPFQDWVMYHQELLKFHRGVTSAHDYDTNPLQWLFALRPTSMAFDKVSTEGDYPVRVITALGSPLLWWVGVFALLALIWAAWRHRDWRAGLILLAYAGIWLPWLALWNRTIFTFYMVCLSPFVVLAVTYLIAWLVGWYRPAPQPLAHLDLVPVNILGTSRSARLRRVVAGVIVALIVATQVFFLPIAAGWTVLHSQWYLRMWLPSWI